MFTHALVLIQYRIYVCLINFIVLRDQYYDTISEAANSTCDQINNDDDDVQEEVNNDELLITYVARATFCVRPRIY